MQNLRETIKTDFPYTTEIKVEWRHMDAAGHVHNMEYFGYFESCRITFFEALKFDVVPQNDVGVVVGKVDCKYIYPITYPDTIFGRIRLLEYGDYHITLEIHLFSEKYNRIVAISNQKLVFYHYGIKMKAKMPDGFLSKIKHLNHKK